MINNLSQIISLGFPFLLCTICVLSSLFQTSILRSGEEQGDLNPPAFSQEYDTVEARAIEQQILKDLEVLSIGQVSQFHRHLVETLGPVLPKDVEVKYEGPLVVEAYFPHLLEWISSGLSARSSPC